MTKFSDISLEEAAEFCRCDADDKILKICLESAKSYVLNETALTADEADLYDDISSAVLILCSDMYDNRSYASASENVNQIVESIVSHHRRNLI